MRNRLAVIRIRCCSYSCKSDPIQFTDDAMKIRTERQRITEQHPLQRNDANDNKALHQNGQNVLTSNQTSIEKCQSRYGH